MTPATVSDLECVSYFVTIKSSGTQNFIAPRLMDAVWIMYSIMDRSSTARIAMSQLQCADGASQCNVSVAMPWRRFAMWCLSCNVLMVLSHAMQLQCCDIWLRGVVSTLSTNILVIEVRSALVIEVVKSRSRHNYILSILDAFTAMSKIGPQFVFWYMREMASHLYVIMSL